MTGLGSIALARRQISRVARPQTRPISPRCTPRAVTIASNVTSSASNQVYTPLSLAALSPAFAGRGLAQPGVRRFLRRFLTNHDMDLPVLSHKEVAPQYKVQPLAMLSLR